MDVTRKNFKDILEEFEKSVTDSSFLAIDAEFSGLSRPENEIKAYDTPAVIYAKNRKSAKAFLILQFGVSVFTLDSEGNKYVVRTYNFNIMPRSHSRAIPDRFFLCQSSSLSFLARQSFDFNKVFYDGISYMLPDDEKTLRDLMLLRHADRLTVVESSPSHTLKNKSPASQKPDFISDKIKDVVNTAVKTVEDMLTTDEDEFSLDVCPFYQCRAIKDQLTNKYGSELYVEIKHTMEDRLPYVHVRKIKNQQDIRDFELESQACEMEDLSDAVGFCKAISIIIKSEKLIVGHNMYLDLLRTIDQFLFPLPEEYEEFKSLFQAVFPQIIDTKHVAQSKAFKDHLPETTLESLHKDLQKEMFPKVHLEHAEGFNRYTGGVYLHEAGYDAYLTGVCFSSMAAYLNGGNLTLNMEKLSPLLNRINIRNVFDVTSINLKQEDVLPSRDHAFHVSFEQATKITDLWKLFSPFGKVKVSFLNSSSALVVLNDASKASLVKQKLLGSVSADNSRYTVITCDEFVSSLYSQKSACMCQCKCANGAQSALQPSIRCNAGTVVDVHSVKAASTVKNEEKAKERKRCRAKSVGEEPPTKKVCVKSALDSDKNISDVQPVKDKVFEEPEDW